MLVLSRKEHEKILIGKGRDQVAIMIVRIAGDKVRVGIEAPEHMNIVREEIAGQFGLLSEASVSASVSARLNAEC